MSTSTNHLDRRSALHAAVAQNSFCTLATTSADNRPHVAGVLYALVGRDLYVHTDRPSRKARNIVENPRAAVCVVIPAAPDAPPNTVTIQGAATLLEPDDSEVRSLIDGGQLASITSHGELERPDTCFVKLSPGPTASSYGVGVSDEDLAADPLNAFGRVAW
jgi:general stress protein 26